jgi:hypothetical protein
VVAVPVLDALFVIPIGLASFMAFKHLAGRAGRANGAIRAKCDRSPSIPVVRRLPKSRAIGAVPPTWLDSPIVLVLVVVLVIEL